MLLTCDAIRNLYIIMQKENSNKLSKQVNNNPPIIITQTTHMTLDYCKIT